MHKDNSLSLWLATLGILMTLFNILILQKDLIISKIVDKISVEIDQKIGSEGVKTLNGNLLNLKDDELQQQLNLVLESLLPNSTDGTFKYEFHVEKNDQINAFALPGGPIILYSGLINSVDSPEELLAVVAHEISHIKHRHHIKNLINHSGNYIILSIIFGGAANADLLKEGGNFLTAMSYSRKQESEADVEAIKILSNACVSTQGMVDFFSKLTQKNSANHIEILNTHPNIESRIEDARNKTKDHQSNCSKDIKFDLLKIKSKVN